MNKIILALVLALCNSANAYVTLPYSFSPSTPVQSSQVNANFSAVANEINTHESAVNPHQTTLTQILALGNSCGTYSINFNDNQALNFEVENVTADPTPGNIGRMIYNTTTGLLKFDNGTSIVSIAGSGVNNLTSVLNSGNSAGSFNIDMNENQLLHARVENLSSAPSAGNAGRLYYNTSNSSLNIDNGSSWTAIGGSQGLASVLGVSNSAGSYNINFNQKQANGLVLDELSADPGSPVTGQIWFNTTYGIPKFYNGSSYLSIGNTNTLAQTLSLGNSVGSNPINFNSQQAQNMLVYNVSGSPGTGTGGLLWYNTSNSTLNYETSSANHQVTSNDQTQTLTNKTISGASNTLTNIQDSSLSANVDLLNTNQSISGTKTFTSSPEMGSILSNGGGTIMVPTLGSNDTFALLGASQTLTSTTLSSGTLTGNTNFSEGQATAFRIENLSSDPTPGNAGRLYFKTSTGEFKYDDGTNVHVLLTNTASQQTLTQVLAQGNNAGGYNINMNDNQMLSARVENVGTLPVTGNAGRIVYDTANTTAYVDTGSTWSALGSGGSAGLNPTSVIVTTSTTLTAVNQSVEVNSSSATNITLPAASSLKSGSNVAFIAITNTGTGIPTVIANGSDTIDGAATFLLQFQWSSITLYPNNAGNGWIIE